MADISYSNSPSRKKIIQDFIDQISARSYLEIGVASGKCFFEIECPRKLGVDPKDPAVLRQQLSDTARYIQSESDEFFASIAPTEFAEGFNVCFIDGFHSYEQAFRDIENALAFLKPGGCIIVHDCSPQSAEEEQSLSSAQASRYDGPWTGPVWKAIARLRSERSDLFIRTINSDAGCAIIFPSNRQQPTIALDVSALPSMIYRDLESDRTRLLGLVHASELDSILATHAAMHQASAL